jgi:hypothetical protein
MTIPDNATPSTQMFFISFTCSIIFVVVVEAMIAQDERLEN